MQPSTRQAAVLDAVSWIDQVSAQTLTHLDDFDSLVVIDELAWRLARVAELDAGMRIAVMQLTAPVVAAPRALEVQQLVDPIARRVVELLGEEPPIAPKLVDAVRAARLLGITEHAFRTRLQRGQIPRGAVVRTGGRLQFRPDRLVRDR
jgi:hypothetical protein